MPRVAAARAVAVSRCRLRSGGGQVELLVRAGTTHDGRWGSPFLKVAPITTPDSIY